MEIVSVCVDIDRTDTESSLLLSRPNRFLVMLLLLCLMINRSIRRFASCLLSLLLCAVNAYAHFRVMNEREIEENERERDGENFGANRSHAHIHSILCSFGLIIHSGHFHRLQRTLSAN